MTTIKEATIEELIDASGSAVKGLADKNADFIRGSDYESLLGPSAIIWSRQMQRDTDLFNGVNFNTADGEDLTDLVLKRFGKTRIPDSRGTGTAKLTRPSGGIAETIWKGTRILAPGGNAKEYRVVSDVVVSSSQTIVDVAIEAVKLGPGSSIELGPGIAQLADLLVDPTWTVQHLQCGDGQVFEKAEDFRARVRKERFDERVGQTAAIIAACKKAGAANVELFRSDYAGDAYDHGLNVVYVGDLGFSGDAQLVKACTLALQGVGVAGDHAQVLPMTRVDLDIIATVFLSDHKALFDVDRLRAIHAASLQHYLNGSSGRFTYSLDGLRGAIARKTPEVQRVVLTSPSVEDQIVVGPDKNFPAVLNRYIPGNITLTYKGP